MKKKVFRTLIEVIVVIAIIIFFALMNEQITEERKSSFVITPDSDAFAFQVESVCEEGSEVVIKGWFFELSKVRNVDREVKSINNPSIFLDNMDLIGEKNIDGTAKAKKGIRLKVQLQKRLDIDNYFKCEFDYSNCGFIGSIDKDQVDLKNGKYQIVLKQNEDDETGMVLAYLIDGKLNYINPKDEIKLNVNGTDLEKIVEEGTCVVSSPENHICVYQFGWKLYWIADREYNFDKTGSTLIQYQMDTTQYEQLPKGRIEKGWYWSNLGSSFEGNEITDSINCGEYRVSVRDLPTEYSLTRIVTGYYADGKWVWKRYFRPDYRLIENIE